MKNFVTKSSALVASLLVSGAAALAVMPVPASVPMLAPVQGGDGDCLQQCGDAFEAAINQATQDLINCNNGAIRNARGAYQMCNGDPVCQTAATAQLLADQLACIAARDAADQAALEALDECIEACGG